MQNVFDVVQTRSGNAIAGALIYVYDSNNVLATLYSDNGVTPLANPVTSNNDGEYQFYAANGTYKLVITATGYDGQTINGKVLFDPADANLPITLQPGEHIVVAVPGSVATLESAITQTQSQIVPPGASLTIEIASGFDLSAVSGLSHPDCPRVSVVDLTQSAGADTVKSALMSDYDGIKNGAVVSEPVNIPQTPAAGATSTVTLSRVQHLFSWAERVAYFPTTGEGIDAFSLPTGVYRLAGTEVGNFPLLTTPQKAGLLIVPGAQEGKTQWFLSDTGGCWRRVWSQVLGAPVWGSWNAWSQEPVNNGDGSTTGNFDWNTITEPGIYRRNSAGAGTSNGPTTNFVGLIEVIANYDRSYILQRAYQVPASTTTYIRSYSSASWSVWRTYTGV